MTLAALPMPKKKTEPKPDEPTCVYQSTRIDRAMIPIARAAAAMSGNVSTQEFISNAVNEVAARVLGIQPLKRLPPPPKPRKGGRRKKES